MDEFLEQAELCPAVATIMRGQRNAAIPSRTGEFVAYLAAAALAMFEGTANPISTVGKLLVGVDLDQGDVGLLVTADQLGRVPAVVPKDERHLVGVGDDMVVGYNVAGGVDDEPGVERHDFFRGIAGLERLFEKALEELIEGRAARPEWRGALVPRTFVALGRRLFLQLDWNVDDGRHDALDERRETRQRNVDLVLGLSREI